MLLRSDNCYGQNKNIATIMCFFLIMKKYPQIKCVNLKYLLKGHTRMEADTFYILIERKKKKVNNMTILTPWDWQQMVRVFEQLSRAQHGTRRFQATHFTFSKKKCAIYLQENKCLEREVRQKNIGMLYMKSSFDSEFETIDRNRLKRRSGRFEEEKFPTLLPAKSQSQFLNKDAVN
ncbi:hypothetical protein PR048_018502 [Dryococelus australis]|uniref:DUF7869 domain-containing protein n=1 Tax=Dryococelus australis TaxID=614101 RepID=A0ABQ9HCL9_9NEOP|nr:hypothetical protein PR048_018502 [Dryococelus australis]